MIWKWRSGPSFDEVMSALEAQGRPCTLLRGGHCNSKIGGTPDRSPSAWPQLKDAPLAFLAQLELSEIRRANGPDWLPSDGRLLFFYDAERQPWGFDPADRDGWSVIYQSAGESNSDSATSSDLPSGSAFPSKRMCAVASRSLPEAASERIGLDLQGLTDEEFDNLSDAMEEPYERHPAHQVGGFARPIQGDHMEVEAQLVSNGLNCGDPSGYEGPRAKQLQAGTKDWVLLLQLDSDDDVEMMWGDEGRLYFWVREEDARRGDFGNVWMILQCF